MPYASGIIIAPMVTLQIVPLWMMSARQGKPLPSVLSVPTTRMGWQRGVFAISPKVPVPCSCMLPTDGPRTITSNLWPQALKHATTYEMPYQEKGKHSLPSHCFPIQQSNQTSSISNPFRCPVYVLQAPLQTGAPFPNGTNDLECAFSYVTPLIMPLQYHWSCQHKLGLVSPSVPLCVRWPVWNCQERTKWHITVATQGSFHQLASDKTNNLLISTPTHTQAPTPRLSPYASEFPAALLQLPDPPSLKPTMNRPRQTLPNHQWPHQLRWTFLKPFRGPYASQGSFTNLPIQYCADRHDVHRMSSQNSIPFGYAAYLAKTALSGIADLHPLPVLQMVSGDINQPEGYPDAMPLDIALAQPDRDILLGQMEKELNNTPNSSIGGSSTGPNCHETQSPYRWCGRSTASVTRQALLWSGRPAFVQEVTAKYMAIPIGLPSPQSCRGPPFAASSYSLCFLDGICGPSKVKTDIYMTLPRATTILNIDPSKQLLKLNRTYTVLRTNKSLGMSTSRRDSKNVDSWYCSFFILTMPHSFHQVPKQLMTRLLPSRKHSIRPWRRAPRLPWTRFICHTNGQMEVATTKIHRQLPKAPWQNSNHKEPCLTLTLMDERQAKDP